MNWTIVEKTDLNDERCHVAEYLGCTLHIYEHDDGSYEGIVYQDQFFCNMGTHYSLSTMKDRCMERAREIMKVQQ